jgi:hypothetical protein
MYTFCSAKQQQLLLRKKLLTRARDNIIIKNISSGSYSFIISFIQNVCCTHKTLLSFRCGRRQFQQQQQQH